MELVELVLLIVFAVFLFVFFLSKRLTRKQNPPGPRGWPVIGNMLDLGAMPHQTLYKLQFKYGPVLWLKLGSVNTMVVQSANAAADFFKNHDSSFCDRKCPVAFTAHSYDQGSIAVGRYGPYWRFIRRLCSMELFVNRRINETAHVRKKCIGDMMRFIEEDSFALLARGESGEVNLSHYLSLMGFNLIGNLILSKDLLDPKSKEGREFFEAQGMTSKWAGKPNMADFFPILKWLDPQGIKRNMKKDMGHAMEIIAGFIKEKFEEQNLGTKKENKDLLDVLLEYEGQEKISEQNVKIFVLEMFFAGTDTTSTTLEWTMAELLRHPDCIRKAKEELDRVIGPNKNVEESDIDNLPYLQAILKESMRLHPVVPLLLPRNALQDTNFMGYHIPKDTQIFVNVWAIGRDSSVWKDPLSFKPERFLGLNIDYKGHKFELIPFGSGRRICVGLPLAHRIIHVVLASLLHYFDWELGNNLTPETLNMNERPGISVRMLTQLKAIPKKRLMNKANAAPAPNIVDG